MLIRLTVTNIFIKVKFERLYENQLLLILNSLGVVERLISGTLISEIYSGWAFNSWPLDRGSTVYIFYDNVIKVFWFVCCVFPWSNWHPVLLRAYHAFHDMHVVYTFTAIVWANLRFISIRLELSLHCTFFLEPQLDILQLRSLC